MLVPATLKARVAVFGLAFALIGFCAGIAWERHGRFVCPVGYQCVIGGPHGPSVLIERSIANTPKTGSMGMKGAER